MSTTTSTTTTTKCDGRSWKPKKYTHDIARIRIRVYYANRTHAILFIYYYNTVAYYILFRSLVSNSERYARARVCIHYTSIRVHNSCRHAAIISVHVFRLNFLLLRLFVSAYLPTFQRPNYDDCQQPCGSRPRERSQIADIFIAARAARFIYYFLNDANNDGVYRYENRLVCVYIF